MYLLGKRAIDVLTELEYEGIIELNNQNSENPSVYADFLNIHELQKKRRKMEEN